MLIYTYIYRERERVRVGVEALKPHFEAVVKDWHRPRP